MKIWRTSKKEFQAFVNGYHRGNRDAAYADLKARGITLQWVEVRKAA